MKILYLLVHFPSAHSSQGLAKLRPVADSPGHICHVEPKYLSCHPHCQQQLLGQSWDPRTLTDVGESSGILPTAPPVIAAQGQPGGHLGAEGEKPRNVISVLLSDGEDLRIHPPQRNLERAESCGPHFGINQDQLAIKSLKF